MSKGERTRNMDWYHSMTPAQKDLYNSRIYKTRRVRQLLKKPAVVKAAEREYVRACVSVCAQKGRLRDKGLNQAQYNERMEPRIQRRNAAADAREKARSDWQAERELAGMFR